MPVPPDQLARLRAEVNALTADVAQQQRRLRDLTVELQRLAVVQQGSEEGREGAAFAKTDAGSVDEVPVYQGAGPPPLPVGVTDQQGGDGGTAAPTPASRLGAGSASRLAVTGPPTSSHQTTNQPNRQTTTPQAPKHPRPTAPIERWIGQNLLALVGIGILLLGVGIGVRWAIENDYIGPLARIVMGYVVGIALVGFAERLRKGYDTFSSVLLGGGMAVLYFVTYAAAAYYALIPLGVAFGIMVAFTAFTVLAALRYDRQIIAHLGLVGAYGVPFLLSTGGGDWTLMLGYVSVINLGILAVSFYREWRPLVLVAMVLTWLVFLSMIFWTDVSTEPGTGVALGLASFNWVLILGALLAPKVRLARALSALEVAGMLFNGVAYFGIGYYCLEDGLLEKYEGVFALFNATVYLAVALYLNYRARADEQPSRALPMLAAMAIAFVAVAIPIQLDGPWVTVLWAVLGTLVMYLSGRVALPVLRWGSYAFLLLALGSLVDDWQVQPNDLRPVVNVYFLASILVASGFAASAYFQQRLQLSGANRVFEIVLPLISLALFYLAGLFEIDVYYSLQTETFGEGIGYDDYLAYDDAYYLRLGAVRNAVEVWGVFYTLAFAALVGGLEWFWRKRNPTANPWSKPVAIVVLTLSVAAFLGPGLYALSEVRDAFLDQDQDGVQYIDSAHVGWRYIGFGLLAGVMAMLFARLRATRLSPLAHDAFEVGFHVVVLWVLSSELIHQLRMADSEVPYKLGISILWGSYALLLISLGLLWRRSHLRIAAIVLFGATLVKLFAYDLASLSTVSKTIVLVVLGVLLLVMSFLYAKFKDRISGEAQEDGLDDEIRADEQ